MFKASAASVLNSRVILVLLSTIIAVSILGGCQPNPATDRSSGMGSSLEDSSTLQSTNGSSVSEVLSDMLLQQYIIPYEYFSDGLNWDFSDEEYAPEGSDPSFNYVPLLDNAIVNFSLGILAHNTPQALSKQFASIADDTGVGYCITKDLQKAVGAFYFGTTVNNPIESSFAPDQYPNGIPSYIVPSERRLSLKSSKVLENGDIRMVIDRYVSDSDTPVSSSAYIFHPFTVDVSPDSLLGELFKKGDHAYRFVSVIDQPVHYPDNEVHIQSAEELIALSKAVNSGDTAYQNNRYYLDTDIDMSGLIIEPIGQYPHDHISEVHTDGFGTYFDGQGHTIRNLSIQVTADNTDKEYNIGLFSVIATNGVVTNLNLENCNISLTMVSAIMGEKSTGGLAGQCFGSISNCTVTGTITGGYDVGGLVGRAGWLSNITECRVNASVTGEAEVGAFAGIVNNSTIVKSYAEGEVIAVAGVSYESPRGIGGFAGFNVIGTLEECQSSVFVKTTVLSEWVGGFMGYNQGLISHCLYDIDKTPNWDAVDVKYRTSTTDIRGVPKSELTLQSKEELHQP